MAVLGCSWGLSWRSWGVLVPERSVLTLCGRSWEGIKAEMWPKPEREDRLEEGTARERRHNIFGARSLLSIFFGRYIRLVVSG